MSKDIRKLVTSQGLANLADVFFRVIVIANVFVLSGSVISTSLVPILIGLSSFLASFLVPLVTKRLALNRVLFLTQLGKTILLAILVFLLKQSETISLPLLYAIVTLISVLDGFAAPVSYAIVPRYASDLAKANAAISMSGESVQLVGWGLGGFLFANLGMNPSLPIVLALFTFSTILMFGLPLVEKEELSSETNVETLTKGWRLVAKESRLGFIVQANLLEILANAIWVSSVLLVFVTEILHRSESYWGYVNTSYSLGIILGGAIVFRLAEKVVTYKYQTMTFSLLATALVTLLIVLFPNPPAFLFLSLVIGFLSQIKEVPESVLLQESVDEKELVNVYSVIEVVSTLAFSVSVFLMSFITEYFGVFTGFGLAIFYLLVESILVLRNKHQIN
ncbi:ryptide export MFS transporter [Streptococcus sp. HMSC061D10]|uniref:ryptide export MFS transporter n=1 Tax=Streptococcus sp. HMSC061D10 TaxID=1715207 RepID=UPI0008BAEF18|nr:ryptide export MFS transporter [Streptococcus sp. HMSC061D10]OFN80892.1 MFS transporter [Streptococcus sp. HMSC061D10]